MSDKYQSFVPIDMDWQPSRDIAEAAVALLWSMSPDTEEINAEFSDRLQFRDPGGNWSGVRCSACDTELSNDWFRCAMIRWYETQSEDLSVVTPCCNASSTLDALRFNTPALFSRFCLEMKNSMRIVDDDQIAQIARCLGTEVQVIWTRI